MFALMKSWTSLKYGACLIKKTRSLGQIIEERTLVTKWL